MSHRLPRCIAVVFMAAMLLSGCVARPGDPPVIDRLKPFLRLAVTLGTNRVLTEHPEVVPVVVQVTGALMAMFSGADVVLPRDVDVVIRAKLHSMKIAPEVQLIMETLLASILVEVRIVIDQADMSDRQVVVLVAEVVSWIHVEAKRHVQMPPGRVGR